MTITSNRGILLIANDNGTFTVEDNDNREYTFYSLVEASIQFNDCLFREMYL